MRWIVGISIGALSVLALGGCSSGMDVAECRAADWRAIGYEDGVQGHGPSAFGAHRKACAEHGIAASFDAYTAGRAAGLAEFCRPRNGYRLGAQGYRYSGVCPAGLEEPFVAAHADGYGLFERHVAVERIEKRLRQSRKRVQELEYLIVEHTALVVAPTTPDTRRATIAVELKQFVEEKVRLEETIRQLERDQVRAETEYAYYQDRIASRQNF
jgi:hypothetical protein